MVLKDREIKKLFPQSIAGEHVQTIMNSVLLSEIDQ